jgi:hypothetical protein
MTEEFLSESDFLDRRNASAKRFAPSRRKKILRPCIFCEFVQDIVELEDFDPKDEEILLYHLRHDHGLDR